MALLIYIEGAEATGLTLEDDALYWSLYPAFTEVYEEIGQMVDLYGHAEFFAEELLAFFLVLEQAQAGFKSKEDQWLVKIGENEQGQPVKRALNKHDVLAFIDRLKEILNEAYNLNRKVRCCGD